VGAQHVDESLQVGARGDDPLAIFAVVIVAEILVTQIRKRVL
jgi:hypothetical protein